LAVTGVDVNWVMVTVAPPRYDPNEPMKPFCIAAVSEDAPFSVMTVHTCESVIELLIGVPPAAIVGAELMHCAAVSTLKALLVLSGIGAGI